MTAQEFINVAAFFSVRGDNYKCSLSSMKEKYKYDTFHLPRIVCKDGFNISIQVNNCSYCASENGVREFGTDWKLVEWSYPSKKIDPKKYKCEDYLGNEDNVPSIDTKNSVGGYVEIELINSLCEEHGGVDVQKTLDKFLLKENN